MKTCNKCDEAKSQSLFRGTRNTCRPCESRLQMQRHKARPEYEKQYHATRRRFKRHNTTQDWFQDMAKNGCQSCGSFDNLVIDHDHSCCPNSNSCGNCLRGVLCNNCNTAEGLLKSDPERIKMLLKYVLRFK